jgi:hypothetical protein
MTDQTLGRRYAAPVQSTIARPDPPECLFDRNVEEL